MKLGLFYEWPNPSLRDWKRLFEEGIEQIQLAEALGFDYVLIAEHHFSNYGMSPAPLLQALAIAERTQRIRIGTAVLVLPIWQPLRVAEEVAVLDNLSGGRFFCGVGRGYQPHEFARFGVTTEESRLRFSEALDVLGLAWTRDTSFTYEGEFVSVPEPTVVWPKPLQKPHPPLWVAGTSPDTFKLAADRGIVPLTSGLVGAQPVRDAVGSLLRYLREAGKPTDTWDLGAQTICLAADSDAEARESMQHARWQNRAGRALNRLAVNDGRVEHAPYEGEADDGGFWDGLYYGGPERVLDKYLRLNDAGATFASCWMMAGDIEHEKVLKSIRIIGEQVLPTLHAARPPSGLAAELLGSDTPDGETSASAPAPSG